MLEFQTAVEEILDVQVLPGVRFPEVIGCQQETIQHTFIVAQAETGNDSPSIYRESHITLRQMLRSSRRPR
jgi:hypothetical protein